MATGDQLFNLYTTQFSTNLELLLQQRVSLLRGKVIEGSHVGKQASPIQQVGNVVMKAPAGAYAPLNRADPGFTRRWVFPSDKEVMVLIDSFDELKTIVDPKSGYAEACAAAAARAWDDSIIAALFADAKTGVDAGGLSTETFNTTNFKIAAAFGASADVGMTVAKLIEARRILRHYHNDLERDSLCLAIGSQQEADLLSLVQVVSTEFNDRPVLVDGKLMRFLGFDIVVSERLNTGTTTNSNTARLCSAFVKSGMYLGIWKDVSTRVSIRDDLSGQPYQLYMASSFGSTRTQPGKVIQIEALDATGTDITP